MSGNLNEAYKNADTVSNSITSIPKIIPDWTNRRQVVFWSLKFAAFIFALVSFASIYSLVFAVTTHSSVSLDSSISEIIKTIINTLTFFSTSIIGAYVFGVNFDYSNFRKSALGAITNVINKNDKSTEETSLITDTNISQTVKSKQNG